MVVAYASPNNPGCIKMAKELTRCFPNQGLRVVERPPADIGVTDRLSAKVQPVALVIRSGEERQCVSVEKRISEILFSSDDQPKQLSLSHAHETTNTPSCRNRLVSLLQAMARPLKILRRRRLLVKDELVFLLYLNRHTFSGESGIALAQEVKLATASGVRIVTIHEKDPALGGCEFAELFQATPTELLDAGLYSSIALVMHPAPHRVISLALVAQALGASTA